MVAWLLIPWEVAGRPRWPVGGKWAEREGRGVGRAPLLAGGGANYPSATATAHSQCAAWQWLGWRAGRAAYSRPLAPCPAPTGLTRPSPWPPLLLFIRFSSSAGRK